MFSHIVQAPSWIMPEPDIRLPEAADILLIGTAESEENFLALWERRDILDGR
jgi:hypothetical protein